MIVATYTTLSVYFMGMGRIVALYAQQGALPRVVGRYSSRSVPWVAIVLLGALRPDRRLLDQLRLRRQRPVDLVGHAVLRRGPRLPADEAPQGPRPAR